jgi:hypothetical protein
LLRFYSCIVLLVHMCTVYPWAVVVCCVLVVCQLLLLEKWKKGSY